MGIWAPLIGFLRNEWAACVSRQSLYNLRAVNLFTGYPLRSELAQKGGSSQTYKRLWFTWMIIFFQRVFGCPDIVMLEISPIK